MAEPVGRPDGSLTRLAHWTSDLQGWKAAGVAAAAGALLALALPPFHIVPVAFVSFTVLLWQLSARSTAKAGFLIGWAFGFGFFAAGLYWIGHSFSVRSASLGPVAPLAIAGLSAGLGIFGGFIGAAYCRIARPGADGLAFGVVLLAALWTLAEMVRGVILTGFPWNLAATIWPLDLGPGLAAAQSTKVIGVYGLSFLTVAACASPAVLARGRVGVWRNLRVPAAWFAAFAVIGVAGWVATPSSPIQTVPGVTLRLVQPSIPQREKWDRRLRERNLGLYVSLSRQPSSLPGRDVTHVIWPETAATFPLAQDHQARLALAAAVAPAGGLWITGAPRVLPGADGQSVWNSLHAVAPNGAVVSTYDKFHLVPFGEYMPLRDILPFDKMVPGGDFSAGPGLQTLTLPGLPPVTPLICYEIIFPGAVVGPPVNGASPQWILNVTNDAWFGVSTGPHQHLASARFRAIEEGLPVVRSANTGVSAVIEPFGRIELRLALGESGALDSELPAAHSTSALAPARAWLPILGLILIVSIGIVRRWRTA